MGLIKLYYLLKRLISPSGTKDWLIGTEMKYGGIVTDVAKNKVSPFDPRSKKRLKQGGMVGGDRMFHHAYAKDYARHLLPFINSVRPITVAEFGILKGTGLAIWCDLFPQGNILGFDIDLGHFQQNFEHIKQLGAFKANSPRIFELDQFVDNTKYLGKILKNRKIDIVIDDALHFDQTILKNLQSVMPHLADNFVYFVEDNENVHKKIRRRYPNLKVESRGLLTILSKQV